MHQPAYPWHVLSEPRIAVHAAGSHAAWVWSLDGSRLIWANPQATALFGVTHCAELAGRDFPLGHPAAAQIAQIAANLPVNGAARLDRLRGFGATPEKIETCLCTRLELGGAPAILVVATEAAQQDLSLHERAEMLFAGIDEPLAVYSARGELLLATPDALTKLKTMPSSGLSDLLARGGRIGEGDDEMLLLRWPDDKAESSDENAAKTARLDLTPIAEAISAAQKAIHAALDPLRQAAVPVGSENPAQERISNQPRNHSHDHTHDLTHDLAQSHPLRFAWTIASDHRFSIEACEFLDLIGPGIVAELNRSWMSIASDLGLDPKGEIAKAIASHDTWSGIHIEWPVEGSAQGITVELAGLPVFDRDRNYRGYRGFGICRNLDQIAKIRALRARASVQPSPAPEAVPAPEAAPVVVPLSVIPAADNVLPFRPSSNDNASDDGGLSEDSFNDNDQAPALSQYLEPQERQAFEEIATRLKDAIEPDSAAANETRYQSPARSRVLSQQPDNILDMATDGMVKVDRDGIILAANAGAAHLFRYDDNELTGLPFTNLFAASNETLAREMLTQCAAQKSGTKRDMTGRTKRGEILGLSVALAPAEGADHGIYAAFQDLSAWRSVENKLIEERKRAEAASQAKSDFLAKVSHEIRTPLNAIIGFSELMIAGRFGQIGNERYLSYLHDIQASGAHIASLVNDLLDLSKIEAGKLDLSFEPINLNDLTQQSVALMAPQANRGRVIIRTSLAAQLPPVVADLRSVRQIMLNLLSNSIKFTAAGGQVILSTARSERGEAILRVRDTGIGMSGKDIAAAMEPFRQVKTEAQPDMPGTGLGLPLTKALAEANSARFSIKSERNAGTLVEIVFPPVRAAE